MAEQFVLVDSPAVAGLRRRVGPVAWCALEVLMTHRSSVDGGLVVEASVRVVAGELAVAKNTAQRALRTLRSAGVVEPAQGRGAGGRFGPTTYRVHLPADIQRALLPVSKASRRPRRSPPAPAARVGEQLVLPPA